MIGENFKLPDDVANEIPDEKWAAGLLGGVNNSLKGVYELSKETMSSSRNTEIVSVPINVGSPWNKIDNFTGNYIGGDSGTGVFVSSAFYMKHYDGSVEFQGNFLGPTAPGFPAAWWIPHTVMTLRPEYRPVRDVIFPVLGYQNPATFTTAASFISINPLGVVQSFGPGGIAITAPLSAPSAFFMNFRYMAKDSRPAPVGGFPVSFKISRSVAPIGIIPIAAREDNQNIARPVPMIGNADWEFSVQNEVPVVTINNLSFSGFNNRITVDFLVIYK